MKSFINLSHGAGKSYPQGKKLLSMLTQSNWTPLHIAYTLAMPPLGPANGILSGLAWWSGEVKIKQKNLLLSILSFKILI